jgi:hypothetical protein
MNSSGVTHNDLLLAAMMQEEHAKQVLLQNLGERAQSSEAFRQRLKDEPEKVVREVAASLPSEQKKNLSEQAISDTTSKVKALMSEALPGIREDEVARLVFGTISDARKSFNLSLHLTQILFFTGLIMIGATFVTLLIFDQEDLQVLLFGGGSGFLGVVTALLINPIDRVQNAAGNLVQLEIAFLSYYKQLTMLRLTPDNPRPKDIIAYSAEVRNAMRESVEFIERFCEYRGGKMSKFDVEEERRPVVA